MKYLIIALFIALFCFTVKQSYDFNHLAAKYEEEFRIEISNYNASREYMSKYVDCQNESKNMENRLTYRLQETTDILESITRCSYHGVKPDSCVGKLDLKRIMEDNRNDNF